MTATHVIGIADCAVTNNPEAVLVTYALGSCIAVTLHDNVSRVGGLLHLMLPESNLDTARAQSNPYMFANTGIPLLFNRYLRKTSFGYRTSTAANAISQVRRCYLE